MYDHLTILVKHRVMSPNEAAEYFGPLLIVEDSPYEESVSIFMKFITQDRYCYYNLIVLVMVTYG